MVTSLNDEIFSNGTKKPLAWVWGILKVSSEAINTINQEKNVWQILEWLIDCLVFYAVSAIFQPFNGGYLKEFLHSAKKKIDFLYLIWVIITSSIQIWLSARIGTYTRFSFALYWISSCEIVKRWRTIKFRMSIFIMVCSRQIFGWVSSSNT